MKRIGINIALGPVCDINTEPMNPIIGMRSFGESRDQVTNFSLAYMHGLQENGILATAKHYPGHGDTQGDSHLLLPPAALFQGEARLPRTVSLYEAFAGWYRLYHDSTS